VARPTGWGAIQGSVSSTSGDADADGTVCAALLQSMISSRPS
jgi:hypothetical protein